MRSLGILDPLGDGVSSIERLPIEPSDLQVVNAARVSMHKIHTEVQDKDAGLINYLAKHQHWTPFSHAQYMLERKMTTQDYVVWCAKSADEQFVRAVISMGDGGVRFYERGSLYAFIKHGIITASMWGNNELSLRAFNVPMFQSADPHLVEDWTPMLADVDNDWWNKIELYEGLGWNAQKLKVAQFRIKMPIFIARQWYKHQIGFTRNEVSRRYVSDAPEFFIPNEWRLQAPSVKQGSSNEVHRHSGDMQGWIANATESITSKYNELMNDENICPEQARSVLPQSMYTEFVETGSIFAYRRLIELREDPHAQLEVRKYAINVKKHLTFGK
jgi:thymidylate synthase (FAD)